MSKIFEKSWKLLRQEITFTRLAVWATAFRHNYQTSIFSRTWWNIIISQTFFAFVMILVFWLMLYYTKTSLLDTFVALLQESLSNQTFDPNGIEDALAEIDKINYLVLGGALAFALCTGVLVAYITLKPAREAFRRQKNFIGAIAHELRTPLAVLRTQNEVALYDVTSDSPLYETIQDNIDQTQRLTRILNNLLLFNRIDTTESIPFEPTNLEPIVQSVCERLEKLAARHRVILSVKNAQLPDIYANETAVEQALYNVVKNAIIYSKQSGGQVHISTSHEHGDRAVISVTDNGVGIPERKLKHIFEPFYRIEDEQGKSTVKGTGLGLALVFEIVKLHKGTIGIASTEGAGTTITLKLPFLLQNTDATHEFKRNTMNFNFEE